MGFRDSCYATVWEVQSANPEKKLPINIRFSITRKDKNSNEYIQDFSGYANCYGTAATLAETLQPKDRVQLLKTDVSSRYDKETKKTYYNFRVYEMVKASSTYNATNGSDPQNAPQTTPPEAASTGDEASDDELPF